MYQFPIDLTSIRKSFDTLLQPLLPLLLCPATRDVIVDNAIKHHCRGDMHACQSVCLDLHFHVVRHTVASVQASILTRLIADLKQSIHLVLIHAHAASNLCEPLVRRIARLIDNTDVEEILLLLKQLLGEVVELA